jgi:hypothetical protein
MQATSLLDGFAFDHAAYGGDDPDASQGRYPVGQVGKVKAGWLDQWQGVHPIIAAGEVRGCRLRPGR